MTIEHPSVFCERCKRPVLRQFVNLEQKTAFCDGCNLHFDITASNGLRQRREIDMPRGAKNVRLTLVQQDLTIDVRWLRNYPAKSIFTIAQPVKLELWPEGARNLDSAVAEFFGKLVFTVMHFVWTATTRTIAYFVNRTIVRATPASLQIEHRPMDVLPSAFFPANRIAQLTVRYHWAEENPLQENGMLFVVLKDGSEYDLLWDLDVEVLLYLEQEIERILGITDEKMEGEYV